MVVAVLAAALAGACGRGGPRPGEAVLEVDRGSEALIAEADAPSTYRKATGSPTLRAGDRVKMVSGSAKLTAADSVEFRLRKKDTELVIARQPVLLSGEALVVAGDDAATVEAGDTKVQIVRGALRIVRDLAVNIGTYEGTARVDSAGRVLLVPALRQASIALAGEVPGEPKPLQYQEHDPWDRRFLAVAMSLTTELNTRSIGLTAQLDPASDRTAVIQRALPELQVPPPELGMLVARPPGEAIVGGAIAIQGRGGDLTERLGKVFSFRDQGATWGLVALDQRLQEAERLVESVDVALRRAPLSVQLASAPAPGAPTRPGSRGAGTTVPSATRGTPPPGSGPTTTEPGAPPTTSPLPVPVPTTPPPPSGPEGPPGPDDSQSDQPPDAFDVLLDLLG